MSALSEVLAHTHEQDRAAFIAYLPVGFPTVAGSIEAMTTAVRAGADVIEIGLPYSDPLLDGPVIQSAASAALAGGTHVRDTFAAVRAVREAGAAAVVMTYWNPVLRYGVRQFAVDLAEAGGSGLIIPDLVPDEAAPWLAAADELGLDPIFLVAPSTTPQRLESTLAATRGFVYVSAVMGVTGARSELGGQAAELVARARAVTDLPLCVGLGVSTPDQAREVAQFADGVIVGSALVRCLLDAPSEQEGLAALEKLTAQLVAGVSRRS